MCYSSNGAETGKWKCSTLPNSLFLNESIFQKTCNLLGNTLIPITNTTITLPNRNSKFKFTVIQIIQSYKLMNGRIADFPVIPLFPIQRFCVPIGGPSVGRRKKETGPLPPVPHSPRWDKIGCGNLMERVNPLQSLEADRLP